MDRRYDYRLLSYGHVERSAWMDAFHWAPDPELRARLRGDTGLNDAIAAAPSEWAQIERLMDFVHNLSGHQGWAEAPDLSGLSLLADVRSGKITFRCVEFSHMLQQVLAAFGFPARVLGLRRQGSDDGLGKSHVVADVWSQEHQKWVELDPQLNTAYRDSSGRLLSAVEVHEMVRRGEHDRIRWTNGEAMLAAWEDVGAKDNMDPQALEVPEGFTREEIWDSLPDHGDFDGFRRFWLDNHYHLTFNTRYGLVRPKTLTGASDGDTLFLSDPGDIPPVAFQRLRQRVTYVQDKRRVEFPLNGVEVQWEMADAPEDAPLEATRALTFRFTHSMPWFARYAVQVDGEERVPDGDRLALTLHPGENTLEVAPVNDRGRRGTPARLVFLVP